MHAIQTSGNCIRNTTTDQFAGVIDDEVVDPRPYCEIIRQWSTFHPEFAYLPRKFKIAVCGSEQDRAAKIRRRPATTVHPQAGQEGIWYSDRSLAPGTVPRAPRRTPRGAGGVGGTRAGPEVHPRAHRWHRGSPTPTVERNHPGPVAHRTMGDIALRPRPHWPSYRSGPRR